MHRTERFIRVARVLVEDPDARHWGYEVAKKAHLRSALVYPMLTRMIEDGLLTDGWVEWPRSFRSNVKAWLGIGRPPMRRYYELTDKGRQQLGALAAAEA